MSESQDLQKMIEDAVMAANSKREANDDKHLEIKSHPRQLFKGERDSFSTVDAYSEFIMNVFDLSTEHAGPELTMCMGARYKNKNEITAIDIEDNGPGIKTGEAAFLDTFMELGVVNKVDNNRSTIGEAGIGAKDAAANLGKRHHYSWSEGDGHPMCHFEVDKDTFFTWRDYKYWQNDDYDGPSFFKISIDKLHQQIKAPSEVREALAHKFAGTLKMHPNVSIYTCQPRATGRSEKITPPEPKQYKDGYYWSDTIHFAGKSAQASIGILEIEKSVSTAPLVSLSRQGVVHTDSRETKAHPLIFIKEDGSGPMPIDARYRDILVTIDSQYFDSAPIKNDLQWKSPTNRGIFKTLGQNDGFRKMLQKIKDYNNNRGANEEKIVSQSLRDRIDKLECVAAEDINKILGDNIITDNAYPINHSNGQHPKSQKIRGATTKKSKKAAQNTKVQPKVKMGGKNFSFSIQWATEAPGMEHLRSWIAQSAGAVILSVNKTYAGYTAKIDKDETRQAVYLADTIGHTLMDYRFELLINNNDVITTDIVNEIQLDRDNAIARYMPIIIG